MPEKTIALIPAYEPEENLLRVAAELKAAGAAVVVVDDGSGPACTALFAEAAAFADVLRHETNRGKGAALRTGLAYIQKRFPESSVVVTADADGQHAPEDILRTAQTAGEHPGTLVLGVRRFGRGTPLRSILGNKITCGVFRLSTGRRVTDTQTGLRAFTADLIPFLLEIPGDRYEYEMNMLLRCAREKRPMLETPIRTVYFDGNAGSHFSTVRDSFLIYKEIFKFMASSLTGFLVDYGLYSLLVTVTGGLGAASVPFSNVTARIVSASVNFTLNRRVVFRHKGNLLRDAALYFALAACILTFNTLLLTLLVEVLGWNKYLVKIFTELLFFTLSWLAQKYFIFRRGKKSAAA